MNRGTVAGLFLCLVAGGAESQGLTAEILSGKLVKPEVGAYAWYDLRDSSDEKARFRLRQAIVGKERIRLKTGYWLETQIIPEVGFPAVYKMLLTGPASDPDNVHRVILQEGQRPPVEIEVDKDAKGSVTKVERKSLGQEQIALAEGSILAEHFELVGTAGPDGKATEVWINEEVRPMGIVRLLSSQGEMTLIRYGVGGADGQSVLGGDKTTGGTTQSGGNPAEAPGGRITVEVSPGNAAETGSDRGRVQDVLDQRRRRP